ncbi:hypothetical protein AURDEDRAFT_181043 [Auricularia subglabra TFB-10046 SS5]|nr:hypothetical protein AURDEDRAFT_181043 [Auricularia subglabra TFB-10046 SS5]
MAANPNPNSPHKYPHQPGVENLRARTQHKASAAAVDATTMTGYVNSVLAPLAEVPSKDAPSELALHAIFVDKAVINAHKALLRTRKNNNLEKASYGSSVRLLNCISAAYYKHLLRTGDAVVFASRPDKPPPGDYLALLTKPDVCAFRGPVTTLFVARKSANYRSAQPWSRLLQVAELKRLYDAMAVGGQLKSYLTALMRYRPDLLTVYGFRLERGILRLAALSPGGMVESEDLNWTDLSAWIAHVVQVYETLKGSDPDIEHRPEQTGFFRWDIRKSGIGLVVTPFHVGRAPGRTTFACFEVGRLPPKGSGTDRKFLDAMDIAFGTDVTKGFWKLSWQRSTPRSTEAQLLTFLHRDGWVPGLVRHHLETSVRAGDDTAIFHPSGDGPGRVMDILHLGSVGQPLSQCETVGDMLDCMYDLIETHAHIAELGVIHRDVSYFNVLCKPRHYLTIHPALKINHVIERPCIGKIFGDSTAEPCVLLTDLDHATTLEELEKRPSDDLKTVGTPMFMSVYLATPDARWGFQLQSLRSLRVQLQAVEARRDIFDLAFPNDDGTFMANFEKVIEAEELREVEPDEKIPQARHDWRHDAESIYWVFLWAYARARPLGTDPPEHGRFTLFCQAMLQHAMNGPAAQEARDVWLRPGEPTKLFAEELGRVQLLFQRFASYLSIPWHLYCGEGGPMEKCPDHAHIALRRLILGFKIDTKNETTLSIRLNTASPRITAAFDDQTRLFATTDKRGDTEASEPDPPPETRASAAMKRKAEAEAADATDDYDRRAKKSKTETTAAVSDGAGPSSLPALAAADEDMVLTEPEGDGQAKEDEPEDPPEEHYDPDVHRDSLSAKALRLMFWKDRALWFGRGT